MSDMVKVSGMLVLLVQALRVSVGKLGIIGRVKLQLVQEIPVRRYADWLHFIQISLILPLQTTASADPVYDALVTAY